MLSVRHVFRLCKQSAQCTLARPSIYFSSNADDSDSKQPPKGKRNKGGEQGSGGHEALDTLLRATYYSQISPKSQAKGPELPQAGTTPNHPKFAEPSSKIQSNINKGSPIRAHQSQKIEEVKHTVSSELLKRLRVIAAEVSRPAGSKANEIAGDLIKKLESATVLKEKPVDINELTFGGHSKSGTEQGFDLLRNKLATEEQVYQVQTRFSGMNMRERLNVERRTVEMTPRIKGVQDANVSLYPKDRLGIFDPEPKEQQSSKSCLMTMERLEERERNLSVSFGPKNWFEQCIQWTEQGKLWHFPIDNEQGLEEQAAVSFTEHVFLEDHLEGWCPTSGPVRHFMELACLGLSKNPYLSVEEKVEYIVWYRNYFDKYREILEASGTLGAGVAKVPALEAQ